MAVVQVSTFPGTQRAEQAAMPSRSAGVPTMSSMVESAVRVGNSNSPKAGTEGIEGISIPASPAIVDATIQDGMSGNPGKVGSDGSDAGLNAGTPGKVGTVKPVGNPVNPGKVGMVKPEKPCAEAPAAATVPEVLRGAMGLRRGFGGPGLLCSLREFCRREPAGRAPPPNRRNLKPPP